MIGITGLTLTVVIDAAQITPCTGRWVPVGSSYWSRLGHGPSRLGEDVILGSRVYDVAGRMVADLMNDEVAAPGRNEITWQGDDLEGRSVSAGVYFYRLQAGGNVQTKRMTLLK